MKLGLLFDIINPQGTNLIGVPWSTITGPLAHPRTQTSTLLGQFTTLENQRLANVTLDRPQKYYFSAAGADGNAGTLASPWRSLQKLKDTAAANTSGALIEFLFNKGDRFYPTNSNDLLILYKGMTIGAYGTGAKPILSAFTIQISAVTSWTFDSGTTYFTTTASLSWLAHYDSTLKLTTPLAKCLSVALCRSTTNSFYHSGGTTYINLGGTNPNGIAFEAVTGINGVNAHFDLYGTNIRCEGVRFEGWGICLDANKADSVYGVKNDTVNATDEQVMKDCELYYTGYHAGSAIGPGKVIYKGVTVGHARLRSVNSCTMFVGYSDNGGHELILSDCTCAYGNLFEDGGGFIQGRTAASAYGHIGVTGSMAFALARNLTCTSGTYSCLQSAHFDNLPYAVASADFNTNETNIRAARGFIFNEQMVYGYTETIQMYGQGSQGSVVRHGCRWQGKVGWSGPVSFGDPAGVWYFNCVIGRFNNGGGFHSIWNTVSGAPNFVNCHFETRDPGALFRTANNASGWPDVTLHNCILSGTFYNDITEGKYDYVCSINVSTIAGNVKNCLIYSVQPVVPNANSTPAGTDGTGSFQTSAPGNNQYRAHGAWTGPGGAFVNLPVILAAPTSSDTDLYNAGSATLQCELDYNGVVRGSRATIGPVNGT